MAAMREHWQRGHFDEPVTISFEDAVKAAVGK
jgi:hypothetical protein